MLINNNTHPVQSIIYLFKTKLFKNFRGFKSKREKKDENEGFYYQLREKSYLKSEIK